MTEVDIQTSSSDAASSESNDKSIFTLLMSRAKLDGNDGSNQDQRQIDAEEITSSAPLLSADIKDDVILRLSKRELQEDIILEEALGSSNGVNQIEAKSVVTILLDQLKSVTDKVRDLSQSKVGVLLLQVFLDAAALVPGSLLSLIFSMLVKLFFLPLKPKKKTWNLEQMSTSWSSFLGETSFELKPFQLRNSTLNDSKC